MKSQHWFHRVAGGVLALAGALLCPDGTAATTPAGTVVTNQAATREGPGSPGMPEWILSNPVTVAVDSVVNFDLVADHDDSASAGTVVAFSHRILNRGNTEAMLTVRARNLDGDDFDFTDIQILWSGSRYGAALGDERESSVLLDPGSTADFVIFARVPDGLPEGAAGHMEVTAVDADHSVTRSNRDRITVTGEAFLQLAKSVSTPEPVPGQIVVFAVEGTNTGNAPARGVPIRVDGVETSGVLIHDAVPAFLRFSSVVDAGVGVPVYHTAGMDSLSFTATAPADPGTVDRVGCVLPEVAPGGRFRVELAMTLTDNARGTIENVAGAMYATRGTEPVRARSNAAVITLPVPAPVIAFFLDADFEVTIRAGELGDPVFVQATAPACDLDPGSVDDALIVIHSTATGDREAFLARETGPSTGIFRIPRTVLTQDVSTKPAKENNGAVETVLRDVLRADLQSCAPYAVVSADLYMEPFGFAFDTGTDRPVVGAVISLLDAETEDPAPVFERDGVTPSSHQTVTDAAGRYRFALVAPGWYRFRVDPPEGCVFPSSVPAAEFDGRLVDPHASYGFVFEQTELAPVWVDIPMDPVPAPAALAVEKTVQPGVAEIGDFVDYTVVVRNDGTGTAQGVVVADRMPQGFVYQDRSTRVDHNLVPEPKGIGGPRLDFAVGDIPSGTSVILTYRASIGPGAWTGDGVNRAQARAANGSSNVAAARVHVERGVFTERGYLVGRVVMEPGRPGGPPLGIPGVRVLLENGTFSITDADGQFSFYDLSPRTHVLKVDPYTLPEGARLLARAQRHGGAGNSAFVDLKNGELNRTDFTAAYDPGLETVIAARRRATKATEIMDAAGVELRPDAADHAPRDERAAPASGLIDARGDVHRGGSAVGSGLTENTSNLPAAPVFPLAPAALESLLLGADAGLGFVNLADGDRLPGAWTIIQVKGPAGGTVHLSVNGTRVPDSRIGKRFADPARGLAAAEYVGVTLTPGENRLDLFLTDDFGNERASASIRVTAPGRLAELSLEPETDQAPADGVHGIRFRLTLTDAGGLPVTARIPVTLESDRGRWDTPDLDENEPGTQVFVEGGAATFLLQAPAEPGEALVRAMSGLLEAEARVDFVPELRPIMGVGLVEGSIRLQDFSLDALVPARPQDDFEDVLRDMTWTSDDGGARADARAALYLKGKVKGSYLLTMAFDTEHDDGTRLFRDIRPDAFYPVYGSSDQRGFDARSTSRLYVRVDKGRSYLLYGDFVTDPANENQNLGAYRRSLTGVQEHYRTDRAAVNAFVTHDDSRQVIEELEARGISGPYALRNREIVPNSETVEILVRDRNSPDVVLSIETRTRFTDYAADPWTGEILFRAPVPSLDENLNPIFIRVTYESVGDADKYWVGGVTASARVVPGLDLGAGFVRDENPAEDRTLISGNAVGHLGPQSTLTAEFAHSEGTGNREGNAGRLELRHRGGELEARVFGTQTDQDFDNPSAGWSPGRIEAGGKATYRPARGTRLQGEAVYSEDRVTGGQRKGVYVSVEQRVLDAFDVELGARRSEDDLSASADTSSPALSNTTLRGRVKAQIPYVPRLSLSGSYEQDVNHAERRSAAVGGEFQIMNRGRLYLRHEFLAGLTGPYSLNGARRHSTVVGLDADYMRDGHAFSEYRARDAFHGRDAEAAVGLRNQWLVSRGVWLHTNLERVHSLAGDIDREATVVGGAVEILKDPGLKATLRLEYRTSRGTDNYLSTLGLARRLSRDWTLLTRNVLSVDDGPEGAGTDRIRNRFQIGAAWRELRVHGWNALTRYEFRYEDQEPTLDGARIVREHTLSLHVNVVPDSGWSWTNFYAVKQTTDAGSLASARLLTQLYSARVHHDFARGWDAGVIGSVLFSRGFDGRRYGLGVEVGRMVATNLWVSLGCNAFGFTDDALISETYTQRGGYLRLRWKFDESLFSSSTEPASPEPAPQGGGMAR